MRRLLVPLLILAAMFPTAALSGSSAATDGTLAVRDGRGKITLVTRGSLIGRFGYGTLKIEDLSRDESSDPVVRGYEKVKWGRDNAPTYSGRNVRFRIIGGHYRVTFTAARAVYFSLVGKGRVMLDGAGSVADGIFYDGFYSLNGSQEQSLPDEPTWLLLTPPPPPPQSSD